MSQGNRVLCGYSAIVDGKNTGLAGCASTSCERPCLRKDPKLKMREPFKTENCRLFIPAETLKQAEEQFINDP